MSKLEAWLGQQPRVVIALIVAITVLLVAAMVFGYDLAWIPALLRGVLGL
ncbi:MAG: hypothetical protein U0350_36350 [Caldilineaceae bacterium]